MDRIRIGFIGLGGICRQRHIPGLQRIPGIEFRAVANSSRASAEKAAAEFNIPKTYDHWLDLVQADDIDMVLIGAWPILHRDASVAALKAGKHVFCQARMARTGREAREMLAAAQAAPGLVSGLCPVPFGLSYDRTVARLLKEEALGKIRQVNVCSLAPLWNDPATPINWRKDHRLSGLNMQTLGMYIEVVHRWFGQTTQVSAESFLYTSVRKDAQGTDFEVKIPDQITANTVVDKDISVHYLISGVSAVARESIDVYGEKGALHYDVTGDKLYFCTEEKREPVVPLAEEYYDLNNWRVEEDFIAAIRTGCAYRPDFEEGLRYMQVLEAVYASSEKGCRISLEPSSGLINKECFHG
ncbi:MAG: Gfo/Idh/MocA family oxidoreductase [Candidatus Hydrogenedens sp.]|jgi:predicted dehydrogenase|nr:Gfo/Idh/MocA family oxidoreductase [Candidatus Hydrogenedens sp.]